MTINWQRRDGPPEPCWYESADKRWKIMPQPGGMGWDVCAQQPDTSYSVQAPARTVAAAKRTAQAAEDQEQWELTAEKLMTRLGRDLAAVFAQHPPRLPCGCPLDSGCTGWHQDS